MKTIIVILSILSILILSNCNLSQTKNKNEKQIDTLNDTNTNINVGTMSENGYSKTIRDSLNKYLSKDKLDTIILCIDKYNNIESSQDLAEFYYTTNPKLFEIIFSINADRNFTDEKSVKKGFAFISKYLPCIALETVDGTLVKGYIDMQILSEKAKETPEPDDDKFIEADISKFYDSWNGNYFSSYVGDDKAISIFGNDSVFNSIEKILKARKSGNNFKKTLNDNLELIFKAINADLYYENREAVMKELAKIESLEFTETEKQKLNNVKRKIIAKPNYIFKVNE